MRLLFPVLLLLAVGVAAPAQAQVTASEITSPSGSAHYVLVDTSAAHPETLTVAGVATGTGKVDIVCDDGPMPTRLATDVAVSASGTFALADIPVDALTTPDYSLSVGRTCRLRALPAGSAPRDRGEFGGPLLGVSTYTPVRETANAPLASFDLFAAGRRHAAQIESFGACSVRSVVQDAATFAPESDGIQCSGSTPDRYEVPDFGVSVDGQVAYPPGAIYGGVGGAGIQETPGFPELPAPVVDFDPASGNVGVTETDSFARCAPDNAYPVQVLSCTGFSDVPVKLTRATVVANEQGIVATEDRWSSTDGKPHRLDLTLSQNQCFGADECANLIDYRFPGQSTFARHAAGDTVGGFAAQPILARDASKLQQGGAAILPGQPADGARFYDEGSFGLQYRARTIPAHGVLVLVHAYATVGRGESLDKAAASLLPFVRHEAVPVPQPESGGGTGTVHPPASPRITRHGHVRVHRSGRTFAVVTRDRVSCITACVVHVSGRRIVARAIAVGAGRSSRVRFRLTHAAARHLLRTGRLRLTVAISVHGVDVTRRLTLRVRA